MRPLFVYFIEKSVGCYPSCLIPSKSYLTLPISYHTSVSLEGDLLEGLTVIDYQKGDLVE